MDRINEIIYREPRSTFMEVLKVHEREVPFARVLGFFFRPKEKHRLGTLFLRALLKTQWLEIKSPDDITTEPGSQRNGGNGIDRTSEIDLTPDSIKVKVEEPAGNDKRIDLLIIGNDFVVCIEFKINHELNNPLKQYIDFTKAAFPKKKHYFLVLSPFRKKPIGEAKKTTEFKLVILSHFFEKIIELLPEHFHGDELAGEYYQYFNDLVRTVENRGIRSTRYHTLTTLCKKLNDSGINSEFQKSNGGYIEMKRGQVSLKIRTKTFGWQLEKWFGSEKCGQENIEATDIGYNELLNRIKTFYKNWINHQPSALHIP